MNTLFRTGPLLLLLIGAAVLLYSFFYLPEIAMEGSWSARDQQKLDNARRMHQNSSMGAYSNNPMAQSHAADNKAKYLDHAAKRRKILIRYESKKLAMQGGGSLLMLLGSVLYLFGWKKGYYGKMEETSPATATEPPGDVEQEG